MHSPGSPSGPDAVPELLASLIGAVDAPLLVLAARPARAVAANPPAMALLGPALPGLPHPLARLGPGTRSDGIERALEEAGPESEGFDLWLREDGRARRIHVSPAPIAGHPGLWMATLSEGIDSGAWTDALGEIFDLLPVAIEIYDREMKPLFYNQMADAFFLYDERDIVHHDEWWELGFPDPAERAAARQEWEENLARSRQDPGRVQFSEWRVRCRDGVFRIMQFRYRWIGDTYVLLLWDVTAHRRREEHLHQLSISDPLTGLWNRRRFREEAERAFTRWREGGPPFAVLLVDIDHLKTINDTHGHGTGDAAITAIAEALRATGRAARLGGDEFAVLLADVDQPTALARAEDILAGIRAAPLKAGTAWIEPSASIGAATPQAEDRAVDDVLDRADRALYETKRRRRASRI